MDLVQPGDKLEFSHKGILDRTQMGAEAITTKGEYIGAILIIEVMAHFIHYLLNDLVYITSNRGRVFQSHQKSQGHEISALGLIWANLDHYEARFSKF